MEDKVVIQMIFRGTGIASRPGTRTPPCNLPQKRFFRTLKAMEVHFTPSSKHSLRRSPLRPGPSPSSWQRLLLLVISTKKPASLPLWEKE